MFKWIDPFRRVVCVNNKAIYIYSDKNFPFQKSATIKCQIAALKIVYNRVTASPLHPMWPILHTHVPTKIFKD